MICSASKKVKRFFAVEHIYDSREFSISLRYRFNTTKSKYKGTGAANDELRRL